MVMSFSFCFISTSVISTRRILLNVMVNIFTNRSSIRTFRIYDLLLTNAFIVLLLIFVAHLLARLLMSVANRLKIINEYF